MSLFFLVLPGLEALPPLDFLNISLTCRFLHWRMFTFSKCYAPYTAVLTIFDDLMETNDNPFNGELRDIYNYQGDVHIPPTMCPQSQAYYAQQIGLRGIFVSQPADLKKPFIFEFLEVRLDSPFHEKADYDRCLPHILPLCKYASRIIVIFTAGINDLFNYPATNEFFKAVKATSYRTDSGGELDYYHKPDSTEIYTYCSYTHQMEEVRVSFGPNEVYPLPIFKNSYGLYDEAPHDVVIKTIKEFFRGSTNLKFHVYYYGAYTRVFDPALPSLEYLFRRYNKFDEYYSTKFGYLWYATITTEETGRRHKMRIMKGPTYYPAVMILIGKEEDFDAMEHRFDDACMGPVERRIEEINRWKMETAVEGDEAAEGDEPGGGG